MTNKAPEQQLVTSRLKELQKGCALLCEHPTPISPGETGNWELLAALGQYMWIRTQATEFCWETCYKRHKVQTSNRALTWISVGLLCSVPFAAPFPFCSPWLACWFPPSALAIHLQASKYKLSTGTRGQLWHVINEVSLRRQNSLMKMTLMKDVCFYCHRSFRLQGERGAAAGYAL